MSARVSRSNRIAQPSTPPVNMPSVKKLALRKGVRTVLRRENDGTVTVVSLAAVWRPNLSRQPDGTVTVS